MNRQRGFTVVEILAVVGVILLIVGTLSFIHWNNRRITWTGLYSVAPPTVSNGSTATFVYSVTGFSVKKKDLKGSGRNVQFVLTIPGPSEGVIESVTDASGAITVNSRTSNTITDSNGTVTVVVRVDSQVGRPFILNAIDSGPGCGTAACREIAAFTVVQ